MSSLSEERVLVLAAPGADAELYEALAQSDASWEACPDLDRLCAALEAGAGALLLTASGLAAPGWDRLLALLESQPPWSDLPVVMVAPEASPEQRSAAERLGHVQWLEGSLSPARLTAALRSALRSRRRQYRVRDHLQEQAIVEQVLRENEGRLRFSLEAGLLGVWQHDLATDRLYCSPLCKTHFGRDPEAPLSHDEVLAAVHPEDRERARQAIIDAIRSRSGYILEYRVFWPDGTLHWLMVRGHATYTPAGQPECTFGVTLDITQRKLAEARQAEQAERLRLLSESAEHLLTTTDPVRMVQELFERVREYLRLDLCLHYLVDPSGQQLRLASCAGLPVELAEEMSTLPTGEGLCGLVAELREPLILADLQRSTDTRMELLRSLGMRAYACNPLWVGDQFLGTLCFATGNRDDFSAEDLEFLRTITHYVAVAQERVRVEADLRDAARRKDEFLAMLAHELRNPLSPVAGAVEIMRSRPSYEQGVRARQVVERQLRRMSRLIDDLLDVSRITTGKIRLQPEPLDLIQVIEGALDSVAELIAAAGHTLEVRFPSHPVEVYADPVRLEQVVLNLVHNAAKYTDRGGTLTVSLEADDAHARLRVRDTGIGIAPELLSHVFDLFTQGERGLDRSQGGLGLGLTLVRNLTQLHGGTVEAFSEGPGQGSEFLVTLPLWQPSGSPVTGASLPASPPASAQPEASPDLPPPSRRVLVVDDNRDSAETLAELAELWGFEVDTAFDGLQGLRRAEEWEPSLVFLDIGMPGLNGYEVARRLRQDVRFMNVTLVALTGYGQPEDIERSRAAGFDHHLVKPIDITQLEKLLPRGLDTPPLA